MKLRQCGVPSCRQVLDRGRLLCRHHWRAVPRWLRRLLFEAWLSAQARQAQLRSKHRDRRAIGSAQEALATYRRLENFAVALARVDGPYLN